MPSELYIDLVYLTLTGLAKIKILNNSSVVFYCGTAFYNLNIPSGGVDFLNINVAFLIAHVISMMCAFEHVFLCVCT